MLDLDALYKIQYGMYIITTKLGDKINGQLATTLFQVTNDPNQVAICLSKNTYTHELLLQSKVFGASVLEEATPSTFLGIFGYRCGRNCFKMADINYETGVTGCPLITDHTLVILEGEVKYSLDIGTHTLFVGELLTAKQLREGVAMTYEYYHLVRKGLSPENAPTFHKKKK